MQGFKNEVAKTLIHGKKYILAVSGGVDSVVLLHVCKTLQEELSLDLLVAHVDHSLRLESAQDAQFVNKLCQSYQLSCFTTKLDASQVTANFESWGRTSRYSYFDKIRKEQAADYILTAHTASDCVETMLMRMITNKEPRGILRVDPRRFLIRPLISVFREQVLEYYNEHKLSSVEDKSNLDNRFLRNKVRNKLLPYLVENFDRSIDQILYERAIALADDQIALDYFAVNVAERVNSKDFGSREWLKLLIYELNSSIEQLNWRIVRECLNIKLGFILGRKNSKLAVEFFLSGALAVQLGGGWELRRKNGGVHLGKV